MITHGIKKNAQVHTDSKNEINIQISWERWENSFFTVERTNAGGMRAQNRHFVTMAEYLIQKE